MKLQLWLEKTLCTFTWHYMALIYSFMNSISVIIPSVALCDAYAYCTFRIYGIACSMRKTPVAHLSQIPRFDLYCTHLDVSDLYSADFGHFQHCKNKYWDIIARVNRVSSCLIARKCVNFLTLEPINGIFRTLGWSNVSANLLAFPLHPQRLISISTPFVPCRLCNTMSLENGIYKEPDYTILQCKAFRFLSLFCYISFMMTLEEYFSGIFDPCIWSFTFTYPIGL